jgi:type I restriction enzyme S subunit
VKYLDWLLMSKAKSIVPELRFMEFKHSGGWIIDSIGNRGDFRGGGTPKRSNSAYWKGNIPWVSSSDISEESIHEIEITRFVTKEAIKNSATKIIPKNSLLIVSRVGVGKMAVSTKEVCTSQDFANFTPSIDNLVFLGYYLKSNESKLLGFSQGMAIKGFTKDDISGLSLPFPANRQEQQKIADCLSSLDALIAAHRDKLDALREHKKGLMQNLFPQEGETVPKLRFPEFEGEGAWIEKKFKDLFKIGSGKDYKHLKEGSIPVYGSGGYMTSVDEYLHNGDSVCIGRKGTIDKPMFLTGKFWTVDTLFFTSSFKDCLPKFIFYIFQSTNWLNHNEAGGVPSLSKTNIYNIKHPIPSLQEQQKIADCLSAVDELMAAQADRIAQLQEHKRGLMQGLFPKTNG